MKKISCKSIRATGMTEFWGTRYADSVFLFEAAKSRVPFSQWDGLDAVTMEDRFHTKEQIRTAQSHCRRLYEAFLPRLAQTLNAIQALNLPVCFWEVACGRWLFEYICVVYDKFVCMQSIDIDHTDIKRLDRECYYSPTGFIDSWSCFSGDFGTQQLVSLYYDLFGSGYWPAIKRDFQSNVKSDVKRTGDFLAYKLKQDVRYLAQRLTAKTKTCKTVLLKSRLHDECIQKLEKETNRRFRKIKLPKVKFLSHAVNYEMRKPLRDMAKERDDFDRYLTQSLFYAMPRKLIEQFGEYYRVFSNDLKYRDFENMVSEIWIGHFPTGIYAGLAKAAGKKLIFTQHGAFTHLYNSNVEWLQYQAADIYLTHGWRDAAVDNCVKGGFACRKIEPWELAPSRQDILFIGNAWPLYTVRFAEHATGNLVSVEKLKKAGQFFDAIPQKFKDKLIVRDRVIGRHWNMQLALDFKDKGVRLDDPGQDCLVSISKARVVIIDQMSTVLAEILMAGIPFIILQDDGIDTLADEYRDLFEELAQVGIVHYSPQAAADHIVRVHSDVLSWWHSGKVRRAIDHFKENQLVGLEKSQQYLLSLCSP